MLLQVNGRIVVLFLTQLFISAALVYIIFRYNMCYILLVGYLPVEQARLNCLLFLNGGE
jgi:hypothetical protein